MCCRSPSEYMNIDRHTDATDTIYTFHTCSYHPHAQKIVQTWVEYIQYFGVKYRYLHVTFGSQR